MVPPELLVFRSDLSRKTLFVIEAKAQLSLLSKATLLTRPSLHKMHALKLILLFIGLAMATPIENPLLVHRFPLIYLPCKSFANTLLGEEDMRQ
jgi:hypothetical protein